MSELEVRIGLGGPERKSISWILSQLKLSTFMLEEVIEQNSRHTWIYHQGNENWNPLTEELVDKICRGCVPSPDPTMKYSRESVLKEKIDNYLFHTREYHKKLSKGQSVKDRWGVVCPSHISGNGNILFELIISTDSGCIKCGKIVSYAGMSRHVNNPTCIKRSLKVSNVRRKWAHITSEVARLLPDLNIEHESKAIMFDTWAPAWVAAATQEFKKNGYAGLSLKEYLRKMRPKVDNE